MKIDPNAPAYPFPTTDQNGASVTGGPWAAAPGMSIRAYIAAKIMAGMATRGVFTVGDKRIDSWEKYAAQARVAADALIAELNKEAK